MIWTCPLGDVTELGASGECMSSFWELPVRCSEAEKKHKDGTPWLTFRRSTCSLQMCANLKPAPQAKAPWQANITHTENGVYFYLLFVQCPGSGRPLLQSHCYSPTGPRISVPTLQQPLEPGVQGAAPGWQPQKPGYRMCVKVPLWEMLVLWSVAEGEHKNDACLLEGKDGTC